MKRVTREEVTVSDVVAGNQMHVGLGTVIELLRERGEAIIQGDEGDPIVMLYAIEGAQHDVNGEFPHEDVALFMQVLPPGTDIDAFVRAHGGEEYR